MRQSLDYVARGEADAGFVYATDAAIMPDKVKIVLEVPLDKPLVYPIAVLKNSKAADESKRFVAFVTGADGQKSCKVRLQRTGCRQIIPHHEKRRYGAVFLIHDRR